MKKGILITLIIILFISILTSDRTSSFFQADKKWSGFFYPDFSDESTWIYNIDMFSSASECRSSMEFLLRTLPRGEYECGNNCRKEKYFDGYVCDTTID